VSDIAANLLHVDHPKISARSRGDPPA